MNGLAGVSISGSHETPELGDTGKTTSRTFLPRSNFCCWLGTRGPLSLVSLFRGEPTKAVDFIIHSQALLSLIFTRAVFWNTLGWALLNALLVLCVLVLVVALLCCFFRGVWGLLLCVKQTRGTISIHRHFPTTQQDMSQLPLQGRKIYARPLRAPA